jgi:hypothetical protein
MTDALSRVLNLVAEGRLTAEEAAPILAALDRTESAARVAGDGPTTDEGPAGTDAGRSPRFARVEVRESGRRIVDLRVPISLGRFALSRVPGLSTEQIAEVEQAVISGARGPILDVEDQDGDGVRIVLE